MATYRQIGDSQAVYNLRYRTSVRIQEIAISREELKPEHCVNIGAIDFFAHLYPDVSPTVDHIWSYSARAVEAIIEAWTDLIKKSGDLDALQRLARTRFPDLSLHLLRQRVLELPPGEYLSGHELNRQVGQLEQVEKSWGLTPEDLLLQAMEHSAPALYTAGAGFLQGVAQFLEEAGAHPGSSSIASNQVLDVLDSIKEQVPLEDYLRDHCSVEFVSDGPGKLAACCPFHEERTPSFKIHDSAEHDWQVWQCFGACLPLNVSGTVVEAAMKQEGFSDLLEAANWLNDLYHLQLDIGGLQNNQEIAKSAKVDKKTPRRCFDEYCLNRLRLPEQTIEAFELSYSPERRLLIPLKDATGKVIGTDTRALLDEKECDVCHQMVSAKEWHIATNNKNPKQARSKATIYACPHCGSLNNESGLGILDGQWPRYRIQPGSGKTATYLYNLDKALKVLEDPDVYPLYLVEGYADVWALHSAGFRASIACPVNNIAWVDELVELLKEREDLLICLIPDSDEWGSVFAGQIISRFRELSPQRRVEVLDWSQITNLINEPYNKLDASYIYKILGEAQFDGYVIDDGNNWLDGLLWQLQRLITHGKKEGSTPKDDISASSPKVINRAIGTLLNSAGYTPPIPVLKEILEGYWGEGSGNVSQFIEHHLGVNGWLQSDLEEWAARRGSEEVRFARARGYDATELILNERAQDELGPQAFVDVEGRVKCGKRNHPSREALKGLMALSQKVPVADWTSIVWLEEGTPWSNDAGGLEALKVESWLDYYTVYLPIK